MINLLKQSHRVLAMLIAALFAAGPVIADRGDKADKHAEKHADERAERHAEMTWNDAEKERKHADDVRIGAYFNDRHRQVARTYYTQHYGNARNCPPGLAKKNNGCLPPGQAKNIRVGEPLPAGVVVYAVPQPVLVQLPPPPYGYRYARIGNDIVLVQSQDKLVVDIIVNIFG